MFKRKSISYSKLEKVVKNDINTELIFYNNYEIKNSADVILVKGVHALQFENINKIADLKIYIHTNDDIKLIKKLKQIPKRIKKNLNYKKRLNFLFDLINR